MLIAQAVSSSESPSTSIQFGLTVAVGLTAAALVALALRSLTRNRDSRPLLLLAAGGIASFNEPVMDELVLVQYNEIKTVTVLESFGHAVPILVPFSYILYWGGLTWLLLSFLKTMPSRTRLRLAVAAGMAVNMLGEQPLMHLDAYRYAADPKPFSIGGFPLYFAFTNAGAILIAVTILVGMPLLFEGARRYGILLLIVFAQLGAVMLTMGPMVLASHSTVSDAWTWVAAVVSIIISLAVFEFLIRFLADTAARAAKGGPQLEGRLDPRPA